MYSTWILVIRFNTHVLHGVVLRAKNVLRTLIAYSDFARPRKPRVSRVSTPYCEFTRRPFLKNTTYWRTCHLFNQFHDVDRSTYKDFEGYCQADIPPSNPLQRMLIT
ncbi:hypothetical protein BaRGS_00040218 [Batillaria attramentaria]|uniref:Uncharacterized protein n=1 Tax=Batillaria attramentaria TaxID=370345 RepID=A0ABD0J0V1_9CAEN